jgi:HSP20 family protein
MKFMILLVTIILIQPDLSLANGGPIALDEMILHHKKGIEKAREARAPAGDKEFDRLLKKMISDHEKELKKMIALRKKLFRDVKESGREISGLSDELSEELKMMEKEIDEMFQKFHAKIIRHDSVSSNPRVEIQENKKAYDIEAELPGMSPDHIKVKVVKNELLIEGRREVEITREERGAVSSEFNYDEFKRLIPLEDKVDVSSMRVDYQNGILKIHLDKV